MAEPMTQPIPQTPVSSEPGMPAMPNPAEQPIAPLKVPMKKACMISLMFPVANDDMAMAIKRAIDEAIPSVENKRYTFQILET